MQVRCLRRYSNLFERTFGMYDENAPVDACGPAQCGQVQRQYERLDKLASSLLERADLLHTKFSSALRPEVAKAEQCGNEPDQPQCDIAGGLSTQCGRLGLVLSRLDNMASRCDL